ncbi:hypothetical protein COM34_06520 [Bacillus wiedmannii]|nr:hypothetical protein CN672_01355 [Bacillus wiedmannii]PGD10526.1 hypothetical protein COM34_06520 [Bacillus wiedmannii]
MVQTHGMEMLSVRERNMRAWKLKKKLDNRRTEVEEILNLVDKLGKDVEVKKVEINMIYIPIKNN